MTLLDKVLDVLAGEYAAKRRSDLFDRLKIVLNQGKGAVPAVSLAPALGKTEGAVNMAMHRLRKRYREILEEQTAATLDDPAEVEDEIPSLFEAIASTSDG
jgi:hypothetical protein